MSDIELTIDPEGIAHTTCPCGETIFDMMVLFEHQKAGHYAGLPPLGIHVSDRVVAKEKLGGGGV